MNILLKIQKGIIIIASVLILIGLFLAVTLRYIFEIDLFGVQELLLIPTFLLYFIGAAQGSYEKSHITADILETYVKSKTFQKWITVFTSLVTLIVCVIITYWTIDYLIWSFDNGGETPGWKIPYYIPHGTIFIGFVLMTIYTFLHLIREFFIAINGTQKKGEI